VAGEELLVHEPTGEHLPVVAAHHSPRSLPYIRFAPSLTIFLMTSLLT
jgi:hypothetical protein